MHSTDQWLEVLPELGFIHGDDSPHLCTITKNCQFGHSVTSGCIPPHQWKSFWGKYWPGFCQSTQRNQLSGQGLWSGNFLIILTYTHHRLVWSQWTIHPIITQWCRKMLMNSRSWVFHLMWMVIAFSKHLISRLSLMPARVKAMCIIQLFPSCH